MERLVKLIIADDEPFICGMLEKLIDFEALGIELAACANDGETLLNKIEQLRPDIVLTDISMPKKDGLEVIRLTREKEIPCRFIIISGYRQFEYAYNALKYEVDDYLLKPVEGQELNRVLLKLCTGIRRQDLPDEEKENSELYAYLIEKATHEELKSSALSLEEINGTFHTTFQKGWYRLLFLKLDFTRNEGQVKEDVSSVINKLRDLTGNFFTPLCYEVIMSEKRDGVMCLLNYAETADKEIRKQINALFIEAKNVADLFYGFHLTLCVGKAVDRPYRLEETKQSCRRASWVRMHYGLNRIIYAEQIEEGDAAGFTGRFREIQENLEKAFVSMNIESMEEQIGKIFDLPAPVLCSTAAMQFVREIVGRFAEIYGKVTKAANTDTICRQIFSRLHQQMDFKSYRQELTACLRVYMTEMAQAVSEKNGKQIRQIYAYIEQHYAEHLSLESMAGIVNLSPVYFSNLFKKESGQNFTEYLTAYRMKKAKEFLRTGDMNINEIACALGYADARYFSKVFKKEVGVKPTDYRKIYG
ncbi:MAG: helix-turn-helix domain-containing protein [Eubacteriales bacterium]|nr:helix-turn-helix domain-containing protein [Eubacteriales bacterium]